jgi:hypothetical protein
VCVATPKIVDQNKDVPARVAVMIPESIQIHSHYWKHGGNMNDLLMIEVIMRHGS